MEQPPTLPEGTVDYPQQITLGQVIAGKYKIREKLGEGGMGAVFIVETIRDVKTQFALKLIKPGHESRNVLARFEQERQALALMNHPNIAKFIDAGTSETGQSYFVMELIKGLPITKYCDQEKLTVEERLKLFQSVCHAVQHAHHKGIIHRDLKPGNILVTLVDGEPLAKVIDFGVAKATLQPLTDRTIHSEIHSIIGTLEYMAPEQAEVNSLDIDTRADIYALGVILYELLTGTLPFSRKELGAAALINMLKMIREDEPAKPSTKLSHSGSLPSVAATRRIDPVSLMKKLRGEIDWIIMKCLEKERARRYVGPTQLAQDIDNYLHDMPLIAVPPSKTYRFRKFIHRHRGKVLVASILAMSLVGGVIGTTWGMVKAVKAEEKAELKAAITAATLSFVESDLLLLSDVEEQAKASLDLDKEIKLITLLDRAADNINKGKLKDQPLVQASLDLTIGKAYLALGLYNKAQPHLERSLEVRKQHLGERHPETLASRFQFSRYLMKKTDYQPAELILRSLVQDVAVTPEATEEFEENCKMTLATACTNLSKFPEAEALFQEVYQARQRRLSDKHLLTTQSAQQLAATYRRQGKNHQADELLTATLALQRQFLSNPHPATLRTIQALTSLYISKQEYAKAEPLASEAVTVGEKIYQKDHPMMMVYLNDLAAAQLGQKKYAEAIETYRNLTSKASSKYGEDHANTIGFALNLASCLYFDKQYDETEAVYLKYQPLVAKRHGQDHATYRRVLRSLAQLYETTQRLPLAERYWTELLDNSRRSKNIPPASLFVDLLMTARCKAQLKKTDNLEKLLQEADTIQLDANTETYLIVKFKRLKAELALLQGNPVQVKRWLLEAATLLKADMEKKPLRYQENFFAKEERLAVIKGAGAREPAKA